MAKADETTGLLSHRTVARLFDVTTRTWRQWINTGAVPLPHSSLGSLLYYRADVVRHRLDTGRWPAGVRFRDRTGRCEPETPSE